jgi:hypothetical protein
MDRLCECGCGGLIEPAVYGSKRKDGTYPVRDSGARFLRGHHLKSEHPPWWKGDEAGYRALHTYVSKHFPKAGTCDQCGQAKQTEYALIHGREYSRDRNDYREMCKRCHNAYDLTEDRGQPPACKCGCGQAVTWDRGRYRWHVYVSGHYDLAAENRRRAM